MKYILIALMMFSLNANEHKMTLSIKSTHFKPMSYLGKEVLGLSGYNENNIGLGYEFNNYNKTDKHFFNIGASVLSDSFYHKQYSTALGYNYLFDMMDKAKLQLGLNVGMAYRKALINAYPVTWEYQVIPLVFPRITVKHKYLDFNVFVIPSIASVNLVGFVHYSIGINF
jgi:hypothetical protein